MKNIGVPFILFYRTAKEMTKWDQLTLLLPTVCIYNVWMQLSLIAETGEGHHRKKMIRNTNSTNECQSKQAFRVQKVAEGALNDFPVLFYTLIVIICLNSQNRLSGNWNGHCCLPSVTAFYVMIECENTQTWAGNEVTLQCKHYYRDKEAMQHEDRQIFGRNLFSLKSSV